MANHQVFLVHGMGNFEKNWSLGVKDQLRTVWSSYKTVANMGLLDRFDFVEVTYNDVFENWRQQWKTDADAALAAATKLGLDTGVATKLLSLARAPAGSSFFQTHVLDVVMYRYLKQVSEEVCQSVRKQILGRLTAFPQNDRPQWSVIAHSLGTSVTHDTLHAMFTQPVDGVLLGDAFMPSYIFMVSNVSKVLWKASNFYLSEVRPHVVDSMGLCWKYGNFDHELDPFTHVDPFRPPPPWFPVGVPKSRVYIDVTIDRGDIQDLNVHALSHYLSHPSVHVPVIRTLADFEEVVSTTELENALDTWRKNRLADKKLTEATKQLDGLLARELGPWENVVQLLNDYRKAVLVAGIDPREGES